MWLGNVVCLWSILVNICMEISYSNVWTLGKMKVKTHTYIYVAHIHHTDGADRLCHENFSTNHFKCFCNVKYVQMYFKQFISSNEHDVVQCLQVYSECDRLIHLQHCYVLSLLCHIYILFSAFMKPHIMYYHHIFSLFSN